MQYDLPLLLTVKQTAAQLNVSVRTVETLLSTGQLASIKLGSKSRRIERDALLALIADIRASLAAKPLTNEEIDITLAAGEMTASEADFLRKEIAA